MNDDSKNNNNEDYNSISARYAVGFVQSKKKLETLQVFELYALKFPPQV